MSFASKLQAAAQASAALSGAMGSNKPPQQGGGYPQQQQYGQQPPNSYGPTGQSAYTQNSYGQTGAGGGGQAASYYGGAGGGGGHQQQQQYGGAPPPQQYGGAPPPQQGYQGGGGGYGQPQGGSQYGAPPSQYGQPPSNQYGQPPVGQYGQAPPPSSGSNSRVDPSTITSILQACVQNQGISSFYPNPSSLSQIAQQVVQSGAIDRLCAEWRIPKEIGFDLAKLSLFDMVILVDDSGSMKFEDGGQRIVELRLILAKVAQAAALFDHDGISIRFLNSNLQGNNITSEAQVNQLVDGVQFSGLTPLGTSLDQKILQPLVLGPARAGTLRKPVLVVAITDGTPAGEANDYLTKVVTNANNELRNSRYGPDALSLMVAQVGNDLPARDFLHKLDTHPTVGSLVDVCSNYEAEADEMRKTTGVDLSPELWLCKLCLGAIDSSYDSKDESHKQPQQQSSYGQPPQQYGQPPQQYGQPPQQYGGQQQSYGGGGGGSYGGPPPMPGSRPY